MEDKLLCCGECTFLKELSEGLGGCCTHPEKEPAAVEAAQDKESYAKQIERYKFRSYEMECRHGFQDVWAARGSARLIWNETPSPILNESQIAQIPQMIGSLLNKMQTQDWYQNHLQAGGLDV